jgi:predicted phage terminase large subunit-like protein
MHETVTPALFAITASRGRWQAAPHLLMLSDKLTQVAAGSLKRLMVFMPPRSGKSQLISQFFPAWYLGHQPDNRVILTSYEADFAATWGWKARSVFEEFAPDIFGLSVRGDSSARNRWDIVDHVGGMNTAGVGGAITGKGADLFIIDDPVKNAEDANSQLKRDKAWDWYQSTAYTRLEPDASMILIMTRWHPEDLGGLLLKEMEAGGEQWGVLKFPAIAEENDLMGRKVGEPLWKERYPIESLNTIQGTVSAYWWAAMYQQSPYARTGKTFKRADFIWIKDIIRVREDAAEVERIIAQAALMDGKETRIFMEQEGGASGKSLISYYARTVLKGYSFEGIPSTGSKPLRAQPLAAAVANGNVHLIAAGWNSEFLDEAEQFPNGAHDDQVDAAAQAFNMLFNDKPDPGRFRVAGAKRQ